MVRSRDWRSTVGSTYLSIEVKAMRSELRSDDGIFGLYSRLYENRREVEYSLEEYLRACSDDSSFYAGAAERLLTAAWPARVGRPVLASGPLAPGAGN